MYFDELTEKVTHNPAFEIRFYTGTYWLLYGNVMVISGNNKESFALNALDYVAKVELGHELDMRLRQNNKQIDDYCN